MKDESQFLASLARKLNSYTPSQKAAVREVLESIRDYLDSCTPDAESDTFLSEYCAASDQVLDDLLESVR